MIVIGSLIHSQSLASLHKETINQGFIVKLGDDFLRLLYDYLVEEEIVIVSIDDENINGFVSCALSSKGIMKKFILKKPLALWYLFVKLISKPNLLKPMIETYKAPLLSLDYSKPQLEIPEVELLSICVNPKNQGNGLGVNLLFDLEKELLKRGLSRYKVIAGDKLIFANKFYTKNGFQLVKQITIHGNDISNLYVKDIIQYRFN